MENVPQLSKLITIRSCGPSIRKYVYSKIVVRNGRQTECLEFNMYAEQVDDYTMTMMTMLLTQRDAARMCANVFARFVSVCGC